MKTTKTAITILMMISSIASAFSQDAVAKVNVLNSFTFTEYLLISLSCVLLAVIWVLGKTVKNLSDQLR